MPYRVLLTIDVIVAAIFVYFFFVGLRDGSITSFNIKLWIMTLAGLAIVVGGGLALNKAGNHRAAIALLALVAVPAFLFGVFMGGLLIVNPRWN